MNEETETLDVLKNRLIQARKAKEDLKRCGAILDITKLESRVKNYGK